MPADQRLNVGKIVAELRKLGVEADSSPDVPVLLKRVAAEARPQDLVLVMSNGAFGGFIPSLIEALEKRFGK